MKRIFDILCSGLALLVLWPVFLAVAVWVRLKLGSPVLFKQQRPGWHGKPFQMIKFRTMISQTHDAQGRPLPDDQRLTPFGLWLRATSLDELPELLNVLTGDMSVVGPRPLMMKYLDRYTPEQNRRHEARPGITGWAQVNGRNNISWEEKFKLDVWYVDHQSFGLDMKILWLTFRQVVKRSDVAKDGHATVDEFMGTGKKLTTEDTEDAEIK